MASGQDPLRDIASHRAKVRASGAVVQGSRIGFRGAGAGLRASGPGFRGFAIRRLKAVVCINPPRNRKPALTEPNHPTKCRAGPGTPNHQNESFRDAFSLYIKQTFD